MHLAVPPQQRHYESAFGNTVNPCTKSAQHSSVWKYDDVADLPHQQTVYTHDARRAAEQYAIDASLRWQEEHQLSAETSQLQHGVDQWTSSNLTWTQLGLITAMYSLGALFSVPFVPILSNRYGRRRSIQLACAIMCLGGGLQAGEQASKPLPRHSVVPPV